MEMEALLDIPFWNFLLSVTIAVEGAVAIGLQWMRPRVPSRPQVLTLLGITVICGLLMVDTSVAQVWQVANQQVISGVSVITFLAIMFRFAIFTGLTIYLWHEWKEEGE
jgi:hypothetical protein